jgi:hypothetical protein
MEWISFFERQPKHGQKIFYYGQPIGVWMGHYEYSPDDRFSPHLIICEEKDEETEKALSAYGLTGLTMTVDRMDAPWWAPYEEGMSKPEKPATDYPADYPK